MKLNPKQVAASAAGAVAAALIASLFGEKGTLVGIALGSVVATTATALVMQSLDRTHRAVRQAVQASDRAALLRRLGGTRAVGPVPEGREGSPSTEPVPEISWRGSGGDADVAGDRRLVASARTGGAERHPAPSPASGRGGSGGGRPTADRHGGERRRIRWPVLATSVGVVFVVALLAVTGVELLAGKPLASVVGSSPSTGGTSIGNAFSSSPTTTMPPTTTAPTSTATTSAASTTSSTGAPAPTTTGVGGSPTSTSTSTTTTTTTTQPSPTAPSTSAGATAGGG